MNEWINEQTGTNRWRRNERMYVRGSYKMQKTRNLFVMSIFQSTLLCVLSFYLVSNLLTEFQSLFLEGHADLPMCFHHASSNSELSPHSSLTPLMGKVWGVKESERSTWTRLKPSSASLSQPPCPWVQALCSALQVGRHLSWGEAWGCLSWGWACLSQGELNFTSLQI